MMVGFAEIRHDLFALQVGLHKRVYSEFLDFPGKAPKDHRFKL